MSKGPAVAGPFPRAAIVSLPMIYTVNGVVLWGFKLVRLPRLRGFALSDGRVRTRACGVR